MAHPVDRFWCLCCGRELRDYVPRPGGAVPPSCTRCLLRGPRLHPWWFRSALDRPVRDAAGRFAGADR